MALPRNRRRLASLVSLSVLALLPAPAAQAGLICRMHAHTSTATFFLVRSQAETLARQRWVAEVTAHDGAPWAVLSAARNMGLSCRRDTWLRWMCSVHGEPCREVAGSADRLLVAPPRRDPSVRLDVNIPLTAPGAPFRAILMLLPGGHGRLALTSVEPTQPTQLTNNLLVRLRRHLTREGLGDGPFITVLVDAPNDMQAAPLMLGNYRRSQPHAEDIAAAIAAAQHDYGPLPVFIIGVSAGAAGAANAAQRLGPSLVRGVVLLSSVTQPNTQGLPWIVSATNPEGQNAVSAALVGVPMLFVHHQNDECAALTPYSGVATLVAALQALARDATLAAITGGVMEPGLDPNGLPVACNSGNGHHSLQGAEAEVLNRIAAWINSKLP